MPKGAELDRLLGRSYAIPALITLRERPGIGAHQLVAAVEGTQPTVAKLLDFFEQLSLVRREHLSGPQRTAIYLTPQGEHLAAELANVARRLFPAEEEAAASSNKEQGGPPPHVLSRPAAREALLALHASKKHLTTPEYEAIVKQAIGDTPILQHIARVLRVSLHQAGLVDWSVKLRGEEEQRLLFLTEKGRRVAEELRAIQGLEEEQKARFARLLKEVEDES